MVFLLFNRGILATPVPAGPGAQGFTHTSVIQGVSDLAAKLYDSGLQFWGSGGQAELTSYLIEAQRTWNALTSFWRAEMIFPLLQNTYWYDLPTQQNTLRPYTVLDSDILKQIEYHLLEPQTAAYPLVWSGSAQYGIANILKAIQGRRDEVLSATGCTITRSLVGAAIQNRTFLPDNVIDIRRVSWQPEAGNTFSNVTLRSSDDWAEQSFNFGYTVAGPTPPSTYRQSAQPPLSFDVDTIPPVPGNYEVLSVNAGAALSVTAPTLLGIPDDWTWVIKFGALYELFSRESLAKDPLRADYCAKRYQEGIGLLRTAPVLVAGRQNDIPMAFDSVRNGDDFNATWQSAAAGMPDSAYAAGLNLIGFGPAPDSSTSYSATANVVQNAPVGGVYVQVARDDYPEVLDYAAHLAMLKVGGEEFLKTVPWYSAFVMKAAMYDSKLTALGQFKLSSYEISQLEAERRPVFAALPEAK